MNKNLTKFKISDIVYFNLDNEQSPMYVISIWIKSDSIQYECRNNNSVTNYYNEFELSNEPNILTKLI